MQSASNHTYISPAMMQQYNKKREQRQQSKQSVQSEQIKPKGDNQMLNTIKEANESMLVNEELKQDELLSNKVNIQRVDSEEDDVRSCEDVDSDELDGDLNLSGEEDNSQVQAFRIQSKAMKVSQQHRPARKYRQEIDTNIFKIEFKALKDNAQIATGDPEACQKCNAIFNKYSVITEIKPEAIIGQQENPDDIQQIWKCEFCNHENSVCIEDEEKPKEKAVNYMMEAAAQVQDKKVMGKKDISVIFVMDQSGSMCVSTPIQGKFELKGDKTKEMKELMKFSDGSDQFLQGEKQVTYVSRMQCLQAAINQQIVDIGNGATDRKVGLVSFNDQVTVVGDGTQDPQTICGDKLDDFDFLMKNGNEQGKLRMTKTINESQKNLTDKLMSLEETGPTALGPALATAVAMAAEGAAGSQVVLCTDGLANIGIGSFDEVIDPEELKKREEIYEVIGQYAKTKGLTVNIVSIVGDECNLDALSRLSELTGGELERVDPISLTKNFSNILSKPIIASNVVAKVLLHKGLQFRNEEEANLSKDMSLLVRDIGNVNEDTEHMFEYTLKKISQLLEMDDIDLSQIKNFPFQTQITYTALDGSKCMRVITELQSISNDRAQVEKQANYNILGQNAIQQSANMAKKGYTREAQAYAKNWGRKMRNNAHTEEQQVQQQQYVENSRGMYNMMQNQNEMEVQDNLEEVQKEAMMQQEQPKKGFFSFGGFGGGSKKVKKSKQNDAYSVSLFQNSKISNNKMQKKFQEEEE